ncbi:response regulator transcription factor [Lysinibacillus irui]|uniref:Response regulator transcription factor n=1 Tax=Lysinibacillus irui TaxID=2998077 RepID=A0ABU5NNY0_9BACI|nr:response regulator transcription factor [Lysinibacillus irui]MEA0555253.1 response regulator transcription factor [Lysinibacillus irui]MEA0977739.1 response regulator transcription factor [Lysinibacillus irui]MEA1043893.1 response regulator transcription factor [Lysinibacillus irui]
MVDPILIIEDEDILREILKDYFLNAGYSVLEAKDGEEALQVFQENELSLIILDIMLPKLDGWTICRRIRKTSNIPIIMLTARADEDDTLLGFELGADDYVTKPYNPLVLLARSKRLLHHREQKNDVAGDYLECGGIKIHIPSRTVQVNNKEISLTHTEYEMLLYLMENKGIVITRDQIITKIWGYEYFGDDRTLNSHMRNLRNKLGDHSTCIKTIVRTGYKFEDIQ